MEVLNSLVGVVESLGNHKFLIGAIIFLLLPVAVPVVLTFLNVHTMKKGLKLVPAGREGNEHRYAMLSPFHEWASRNGFDFVSAYTMKLGITAFLGAWRHREHATYFIVLFAGDNKTPSFTTEFSRERGLDTSGADLDMFPASPGHYKQSFKGLPLDALFAHHLAAAQYLMKVGQVQYQPTMMSLEESVDLDARRLSAYLRTLSGWPFRSVYWYYVARKRKVGKTVEQQHQSGQILLPNDPGFRDFQFVG